MEGGDMNLRIDMEVTTQQAGAIINALLPDESAEAPKKPAKETKQKRWHKANKKGEKVKNEIDGHYAKKQHPETENIEKMLIEGATVPAIIEKIEVSPPTVYVIKNRLKREGKLPQ